MADEFELIRFELHTRWKIYGGLHPVRTIMDKSAKNILISTWFRRLVFAVNVFGVHTKIGPG